MSGSTQNFDLIVIGGGPGGYVAAIRAAQLGMKAAVVERENLGGICLNWGCIPTKALLRSSEINHLLHNLGEFGFSADNIKFDLAKVVKRSRAVAKQLASGVGHLLKKNKVSTFDGTAKLAGKDGELRRVTVEGKTPVTLTAKHVIIATGARARQLPGMEADGKLIWAYRDAMVPAAMPKSLLVIGSGAIGIEFASFFRNMGAEVTVVEVMDRVLPVEDVEIGAFARKQFEKQGMRILTETTVKSAEKLADSVRVTIESKGKPETIEVSRVISAVGIVGNVEDLGLEGTGVKVDRTHILIDEFCAPANPACMRSATCAGRPGWPTRRATRAWCAWRRSPACRTCTRSIGATSRAARIAGRRWLRSG